MKKKRRDFGWNDYTCFLLNTITSHPKMKRCSFLTLFGLKLVAITSSVFESDLQRSLTRFIIQSQQRSLTKIGHFSESIGLRGCHQNKLLFVFCDVICKANHFAKQLSVITILNLKSQQAWLLSSTLPWSFYQQPKHINEKDKLLNGQNRRIRELTLVNQKLCDLCSPGSRHFMKQSLTISITGVDWRPIS